VSSITSLAAIATILIYLDTCSNEPRAIHNMKKKWEDISPDLDKYYHQISHLKTVGALRVGPEVDKLTHLADSLKTRIESLLLNVDEVYNYFNSDSKVRDVWELSHKINSIFNDIRITSNELRTLAEEWRYKQEEIKGNGDHKDDASILRIQRELQERIFSHRQSIEKDLKEFRFQFHQVSMALDMI
jgi:hypothetical protein